jgi:chromosomal replication initiation ATPase DnaA
MDAFRHSMLRAQMGKPLPGGTQNRSQKVAVDRSFDMVAIGARFTALDKKLDTLIHMLKGPGKNHHLLPADVRHVVTHFFGVSEDDLDRGGRARDIARIRQIAFYLCRKRTARSLTEIGRAFGRDHTTIRHGVRRIGALRKTDAALDNDLRQLETRLVEILARRMAV